MKTCTFITGNQGKADYLAKLIGIKIPHQKIDLEEIQSVVLREVVEHKVNQAYKITQTPVLVEDVSLEFNALNQLPGTFIKFFVDYSGLNATCQMLDGFEDRSAIAKCGYGYFDGNTFKYFEGSITGRISKEPGAGDKGFGWDSIFIPDGYGGIIRSDLSQSEYDELYLKIKPIEQVRKFLSE